MIISQIKDMLPKNIDPWSTAGNTGVTGHLTQLLWAGSKKVGCGFISFVNKDGMYAQVKIPRVQTFRPANCIWKR